MEPTACRRGTGDGGKGREVMRAPVSDGEVPAMGGWAHGPLSFHMSCQSDLMRPRGAPVLARGGADVM